MTITRAEFTHRDQRYAVVFELAYGARHVFSIRELHADGERACIVGDFTPDRGCYKPRFENQPPADLPGLLQKAANLFRFARPTIKYRRECCQKGVCKRCQRVRDAAQEATSGMRRREHLFDATLEREEHQRRQRRFYRKTGEDLRQPAVRESAPEPFAEPA